MVVRSVGVLMVLIHSNGGDDAAVTVAGVAEDEMDARELQFFAEAIQKRRPALGRQRRLVDSIDVAFRAIDLTLHSGVLPSHHRPDVQCPKCAESRS
jgi:hypothetical protein